TCSTGFVDTSKSIANDLCFRSEITMSSSSIRRKGRNGKQVKKKKRKSRKKRHVLR
ncbi:hypothetical protein RUM43_009380, partial [Polyplax serrata]